MRTLVTLAILFLASCRTINYSSDKAAVYYDFGNKEHYYSNSSRDFGIELYNGFTFFDANNKIPQGDIPIQIRKSIAGKNWETVFILVDRLNPSITFLQRNLHDSSKSVTRDIFSAADTTVDRSVLKTLRIRIFQASATISSGASLYRIVAFSYRHKWLVSKVDTPSLSLADDCVQSIKEGWKRPEIVQEDLESDVPLLAHASSCFWKSKNNYLYPLKIIDTPPARQRDDNFYEASTTFNSFAGNYHKALSQRDSVSTMPVPIVDGTGISIVDALQAITDSAARHSLVIINEAHTQPLNRRFFSSLLAPLYKDGYRTIFYETLDFEDSEINSRRFPIQASGYYTSEPNFGNNVRKALKLGYNVYPYDNDSSDRIREILEAEHIAEHIRKHPGEKIIIYCGYGHAEERSKDSMMAYLLKQLTGIDPLTIDQTKLVEHGNSRYEAKMFVHLDSIYKFTRPVALVGTNKISDSLLIKNKQYDMIVALPRSTYKYGGIPDWQFQLGSEKLNISLNGKRYDGALLQIFCADELKSHNYRDLIPVTNLILTSDNTFDYYLEPGKYQIYVTDMNRNILYEKSVAL